MTTEHADTADNSPPAGFTYHHTEEEPWPTPRSRLFVRLTHVYVNRVGMRWFRNELVPR